MSDHPETTDLYRALLALETQEECARFLRDLCTPKEIKDMAERWQLAQLLDTREMSYRDIAQKTGASTTTVARVARFLQQEPHQGYRLILDRLKTNTQK